ncbi:MAG: cytochrome c-type biogenesis protein CcmH, partial [Mesorhizobium sp.]
DYIVSRYGEFVLLKPRFTLRNALLWGTPVLLLLAGGLFIVLSARSRRPTSDSTLSAEEKAALDKMLSD